jgi:hypothetical protein
LAGGRIDGGFGIECPRINFPSLDSADFEKFQELLPALRSFLLKSRAQHLSYA